MKEGIELSVVIPVFSGVETLEELVLKITSLPLSGQGSLEIIMVFDSGRSESWEKIEELVRSYPDVVRGYRLAKNYGQQRALLYGISQAGGDYIVTMDEDMQHDPDYIPQMVEYAVKGGYDVVYGRFRELRQPPVRRLFSVMLRKILVTFRPALPRYYSPFRVIRRDVALALQEKNGIIAFIDDYLSGIAVNYGFLVIEHRQRRGGKSSYPAFALVGLAVSAILAYTAAVTVLLVTGTILILLSGFSYLPWLPVNGLISAGVVLLFAGTAGFFTNVINYKRNLEKIRVDQ